MLLFRPVGLTEMELVLKSDLKAFPPRLPEQPYFYPVLNLDYATQIARDWNSKDAKSGFAGFVTEFNIEDDYVRQFDRHIVGASIHEELWIATERLDEFNTHMMGAIEIIDAFYGSGYKGPKHPFGDWYADEIFNALYAYSINSPQDFSSEVTVSRDIILLNFKYWSIREYRSSGVSTIVQERFLRDLASYWEYKFPDIHLPGSELIGLA